MSHVIFTVDKEPVDPVAFAKQWGLTRTETYDKAEQLWLKNKEDIPKAFLAAADELIENYLVGRDATEKATLALRLRAFHKSEVLLPYELPENVEYIVECRLSEERDDT